MPDSFQPDKTNFKSAISDLKLNSQEQLLYQMHLNNLYGPGGVNNSDGSRSSLFQSVQEHNGKYYNIPTVWDGIRQTIPSVNITNGSTVQVPNLISLQNVENIGWDKFPSYDSPEEADKRYNQMHPYMEKDTIQYQKAAEPMMPSPNQIDMVNKIINTKMLDMINRANGISNK